MPPPSLRPSYALPWRLIEDQNRATLTPWGGCLPVSSEPCVAIIRGLATDVRQLSLREGVEGASSQWLSQQAWATCSRRRKLPSSKSVATPFNMTRKATPRLAYRLRCLSRKRGSMRTMSTSSLKSGGGSTVIADLTHAYSSAFTHTDRRSALMARRKL